MLLIANLQTLSKDVTVNTTTTTYLIGLDLGTSAVKGVLLDARGRVCAEASAETVLSHPRDGWVEVDTEGHYRTVCDVWLNH